MSNAAIDVWSVALSPQPAIDEAAHAILSSEERARASRYAVAGLASRFIQSRATLRVLLSQLTGTSPSDVRFDTGPHGKPSLALPVTALHFNLAHSGELALYAFSREFEIGVDVERGRVVPESLDIAKRYFCPREVSMLSQVAPADRPATFFELWVRKEALLKGVGSGLAGDLRDVGVTLDQQQCVQIPPHSGLPWTVVTLAVAENYHAALAYPGQTTQAVRLHQVPVGTLFTSAGLIGPS